MFVWGGGGVGACSFGRKIGIKFFWTGRDVEPSSGRRCSRVRVRRVAVPKNIQPARTKCSWTTTLTGKLSSFSLDPRRSSNFSFCFWTLGLSLTALAEDMARYASIAESCWCHKLFFESMQLFFWRGGPREWRRTNQIGFFDRGSLSKRLQTRLPATY